MSNAAHTLPARLREAAAAIANARASRRGAPAIADVLDVLPTELFDAVVEDARAALDAAAAATPDPSERPKDPGKLRINVAAAAGLDLDAQAVVLIDVARDGTVTVSTYARLPGTPARAIAEWADGLEAGAISVVPFRTVFGWGRGGVPTPLTADERATLSASQATYADRNSEDPT